MCFASRCFLLLCLAASLQTGSGLGWEGNWNRDSCTLMCVGGTCVKNGSDEFCSCQPFFVGTRCEHFYVQPLNCPSAEYHDVCRVGCTGNDDCPTGNVCCREGCSTVCRQPKKDYCYYQGQIYRIGQRFQRTTCENCTCTITGEVSCFAVTCSRPVFANNQSGSIECKNGGTVQRDAMGQYSCRCPPGFEGISCEIPRCYCEHGGYCDVKDGRPFCRCSYLFEGERCERPRCTLMCVGGTCVKNGSDEFCRCQPFFVGTRCERLSETVHPGTETVRPGPVIKCPSGIISVNTASDSDIAWLGRQNPFVRAYDAQTYQELQVYFRPPSVSHGRSLTDKPVTDVTAYATDSHGNMATCQVQVRVLDTPQGDVPHGLMDRNHHRLIVILAPVIGGLVIVGLVVLMLCCCRRHRRRPRDSRSSNGSGGHPPAYDNNIYSLPVDMKVKLPPYSPRVDPPAYTVCGSIKDETYITLPPPSYKTSE